MSKRKKNLNSGYSSRRKGVSPKSHNTKKGESRKSTRETKERKSLGQNERLMLEGYVISNIQNALNRNASTSPDTGGIKLYTQKQWQRKIMATMYESLDGIDVDSSITQENYYKNKVKTAIRKLRKSGPKVVKDGAKIIVSAMALCSIYAALRMANGNNVDEISDEIIQMADFMVTNVPAAGLAITGNPALAMLYVGLANTPTVNAHSTKNKGNSRRKNTKKKTKKPENTNDKVVEVEINPRGYSQDTMSSMTTNIVGDLDSNAEVLAVDKAASGVDNPRILDRYDLEELRCPDDRIFIASGSGSDWYISFDGLRPLSEFDSNKIIKTPALTLVKREQLQGFVSRDDKVGFKKMMLSAKKDLKQQIKLKYGFSRVLIEPDQLREAMVNGDYSVCVKTLIDRMLGKKLSDKQTQEIAAKIVPKLQEIAMASYYRVKDNKGFNMDHIIDEPEFDHDFSREVLSVVPNILFSKKNINSLWSQVKQQDLSAKDSDKLLNSFRNTEYQALSGARFDDRVTKYREFCSKKQSMQVIFTKEHLGPYGRTISHFPDMIMIAGDGFEKYDQKFSTTHEPIHWADHNMCVVDSNGNINARGYESLEPCAKGIKNLTSKLQDGFALDKENFEKNYGKTELNVYLPRFEDVHQYSTQRGSYEIIPTFTQNLDPTTFVAIVPNTAVLRSYTLFDDGRDETRLYQAIMQCNKDAINSIVSNNPDVLNSKYDGITLRTLPAIMVEYNYDQLVDKSYKKSGKSNKDSYENIRDFVNKLSIDNKDKPKKPKSSIEVSTAEAVDSNDREPSR